jgi:uncharacterized protein YjgD (DUF1641 family)
MNGDGTQVQEQDQLALLHTKIDYLTEQLEAQRQRQAIMDELWRDMLPIVNDLMKLSIDELEEVGNDFELEDLLYLGKRLLRDVRLLTDMLDRLESLVALTDELKFMTTPAFAQVVEFLQKLEQQGYFAFATGSAYVMDQIVTEFSEEDVRLLGDNIVTILKTVRSMTQPEVMALANNTIKSLEQPVEENLSVWALMREIRDPEVRKGFARLLNMVKGLANEPDTN